MPGYAIVDTLNTWPIRRPANINANKPSAPRGGRDENYP
jgi:hypothetical protein